MKKIIFGIVIPAIVIFTVLGCGSADSVGADGSSGGGTKGYLVDSPIAGVSYSCAGVQKLAYITDATGRFECTSVNSWPIIFSIGTLGIGQIVELPSDGKVYPQDLLDIDRSNFTDTRLIALTQLLQSLDDDGSYDEVININKSTSDKFGNYGVMFRESQIDEYIAAAGVVLIDPKIAVDHLKQNLPTQ